MLHTKFHGNQPAGSGEEYFKGFYHIWAWRPSWSCDQHHVIRFLFPCKAVVGGTAGPAMAGPLFWPKMVLAGPFFWPFMIF